MSRVTLDDGWTFRPADGDPATAEQVTLPHDAMIHESRRADGETDRHGGYFPGARYVYERELELPVLADGSTVTLVFEGVAGAARVSVDGAEAASWNSTYREVHVDVTALTTGGSSHRIVLDVDNSQVPNSRWYTGSGPYRSVWLEISGPARFARDGVRFHTASVDANEAVVEVEIDAVAPGSGAQVSVELASPGGRIERATSELIGATARVVLRVPDPRPWSDHDPFLYTATARLTVDGEVADERDVRIGLRTVSVDAEHGLRINGKSVLLRGACIHHDSGVLGAATLAAAEYRRVRILKENGFNAIRSSHNPASRAMLEACDELGMYVMDELTDVWYDHKTPHDSAEEFDATWRPDADAMVAKDRNHASVIMYSVGNEVAETATPKGVGVSAEISDYVRGLDPHRPTTVAVNLMLNVLAGFGVNVHEQGADADEKRKESGGATSESANQLTSNLGAIMRVMSRLPQADRNSKGAFATVDVAGYNYAWNRYGADARKYAERVIVGSESLPGDIVRIWPLVERHPAVVGDFMWTGWDYLGETGIGSWTYGDDPVRGMGKPYPHVLSGCGAIDITGTPGAHAMMARAAWGQLDAPAVAVRPVTHSGERRHTGPWRTTDAVPSWSWTGCEGRKAEVEVYSNGDEIQLLINGRKIGRRKVGKARGRALSFTLPYENGELTAVEYRGGVEFARTVLRSADGPLALHVTPDRGTLTADGHDLAHIAIEVADADGTVDGASEDRLMVEVSGAGVLAGLGSADPAPFDEYPSSTCTTWHGRALAVVRARDVSGPIHVRVTGERFGSAELELNVQSKEPQVSARA